jgi:uncharacterized membrane protein YeaQ/YmgE (transglycosylase-associated protein family)
MDIISPYLPYLYYLIAGAIAGWIAGKIVKGRGLGLFGNVIVGVVGAQIGGWLFRYLGIFAGYDLIGSMVTAVVGAVVLLTVAKFFHRL